MRHELEAKIRHGLANGYADYPRARRCPPPPEEKLSHLIRPSRSGAESHGLRTLCGLGQKHHVWRITLSGAATNVNGDGWAVCVACAQRARPLLAREFGL